MSSVPWSNETERADYYKKLYNEQLAICDRLKKDIEILKTNMVNIKSTDEQFKAQEQEANVLNYIKAEAVKEFAERLSEKAPHITEERFLILQNEIDKLVKEMVGEVNV